MTAGLRASELSGHVKLLGEWGRIGSDILEAAVRPCPTWVAPARMAEAARLLLRANAYELRDLLGQWNQRLSPLSDPFLVDFGVHRWLLYRREESYSDWLEWTVRSLEDPKDVLRLFAVESTDAAKAVRGRRWDARREVSVEEGHAGQRGRLDLDVFVPEVLLIQVEVKLGAPDFADTEKQAGYRRSARTYGAPPRKSRRFCRLIASDADKEECSRGYEPVEWKHVAREVRRSAVRLLKQRSGVKAAMLLGFAGAIEQNLLGFSAVEAKQAFHRAPVPIPSGIVEYLKEGLANLEEE